MERPKSLVSFSILLILSKSSNESKNLQIIRIRHFGPCEIVGATAAECGELCHSQLARDSQNAKYHKACGNTFRTHAGKCARNRGRLLIALPVNRFPFLKKIVKILILKVY